MQTRVYEVTDHDVLDQFFSEAAPARPVATLGSDHGELIFDGNLSETPGEGDVLVLKDQGRPTEYVILLKLYLADINTVELVVHQRHFDGGGAAS